MNDTTATGESRKNPSFASQPSSSQRGSPAPGPSSRTYARKAASSTSCDPGTNRFTPNGASVRERTSATRDANASGLRYPAARNPSPPAPLTAAASAGVDGPPAIGAWTIGCSS